MVLDPLYMLGTNASGSEYISKKAMADLGGNGTLPPMNMVDNSRKETKLCGQELWAISW